MDIKFLKIKKKFKKESFQIDPVICWRLMLLIILVMAFFVFLFGFNFFKKINEELPIPNQNMGINPEKDRKQRIEKVLEYFSEREGKSKQIIDIPTKIIDPSL